MKKGAVVGVIAVLVLLGAGLWYLTSSDSSQPRADEVSEAVPSSAEFFPAASEGAPADLVVSDGPVNEEVVGQEVPERFVTASE